MIHRDMVALGTEVVIVNPSCEGIPSHETGKVARITDIHDEAYMLGRNKIRTLLKIGTIEDNDWWYSELDHDALMLKEDYDWKYRPLQEGDRVEVIPWRGGGRSGTEGRQGIVTGILDLLSFRGNTLVSVMLDGDAEVIAHQRDLDINRLRRI